MGFEDRDYSRADDSPRGLGMSTLRGRSVVFWLILINVSAFLIDRVMMSAGVGSEFLFQDASGGVTTLGKMGPLTAWGHFSGYFAITGLQVWRFISFQFLHASIGHILFNMLGLYFFGPMLEHYLGSRRFLVFYLVSGAVGSLFYILFWLSGLILASSVTPLVGASAGVLAVLIGAATIAPDTRVQLLIPPIPVRLKTLAWVVVGIGAFTVLFRGFERGANAGGEAAHLGGCLAGFLLIRKPAVLGFGAIKGRRGVRARVTVDRKPRGPDPADVDRILDKVREQGLASLTSKEKKALKKATNAQQSEGRR